MCGFKVFRKYVFYVSSQISITNLLLTENFLRKQYMLKEPENFLRKQYMLKELEFFFGRKTSCFMVHITFMYVCLHGETLHIASTVYMYMKPSHFIFTILQIRCKSSAKYNEVLTRATFTGSRTTPHQGVFPTRQK